MRSLRSPGRRGSLLAVLAVLLLGALLLGALLPPHHDGLHALQTGEETITTGCGKQHPPQLERGLTSRHQPCDACLLQLQSRTLPTVGASVARATAAGSPQHIATVAFAPRRAYRDASPRAPPVLPG